MKTRWMMVWAGAALLVVAGGCSSSTGTEVSTAGGFDTSDGNPWINNGGDKDVEVGAFEFSPLEPSSDSLLVYVSSSEGNDDHTCLTPEDPCEHLLAGEALLRDGYPDWLMLKKGDVWYESFSDAWNFSWTKSGRGADEPMVVTSYGDTGARPLIKAGQEHGFHRFRDNDLHDLAIVDLHFEAHTKNPHSAEYVGPAATENQSGFRFTGGGTVERILIEGCKFEYFGSNFAMHPSGSSPMFNDIQIRGNVFYSAWTGSAADYSQGVYADRVDGLLIEGNVFDRNGGLVGFTNDPNGIIPAGLTALDVTVTWYNHQAYIQSGNRNVTAINNIFADGDGMQLRPGGVAENNLFTRTINALTIGSATTPVAGGVSGTLNDNVFLEGTDFAPESDTPGVRANGILIANINAAAGLVVQGNVFSHDMSEDRYGRAIGIDGSDCGSGSAYPCPVTNVTIEDNIAYNWRGGVRIGDNLGTEIQDITVHNNIWHSPADDAARLVDLAADFDAAQLTFTDNAYLRGGDANWFRIGGTSHDFDSWVATTSEVGANWNPLSFPEAIRSLADYNATLGGAATHDAFMDRARQQSKDNWDPGYEAIAANDYIRSGLR